MCFTAKRENGCLVIGLQISLHYDTFTLSYNYFHIWEKYQRQAFLEALLNAKSYCHCHWYWMWNQNLWPDPKQVLLTGSHSLTRCIIHCFIYEVESGSSRTNTSFFGQQLHLPPFGPPHAYYSLCFLLGSNGKGLMTSLLFWLDGAKRN